jgi:hypothetical protein
MKFGLFYELQLPKPLDRDDWDPDDERRIINEMLEQVEFADRLGFDYVFQVEHHFLEEYSHSAAPEVVLAVTPVAPRAALGREERGSPPMLRGECHEPTLPTTGLSTARASRCGARGGSRL